jgi:hypothetical protein
MGIQTRDLPPCSIVPQPTMVPRAPVYQKYVVKNNHAFNYIPPGNQFILIPIPEWNSL